MILSQFVSKAAARRGGVGRGQVSLKLVRPSRRRPTKMTALVQPPRSLRDGLPVPSTAVLVGQGDNVALGVVSAPGCELR